MRLNIALFVIGVAFVAISDAFSITTAEKVNTLERTTIHSVASKRFLRTTNEQEEDGEERAILSEKVLMKMSKLADDWNLQQLSKKLEHKSWLVAGETPQTMFRKYEFKGKTLEQLKEDPRYLRYEGFDDIWLAAQHKRGTILTVDAWKKMMEAQQKQKKNAA